MKCSENESEDQNEEEKLESIQDNKRRCLRSTASTNDWSKTHPQEDIADIYNLQLVPNILLFIRDSWIEVIL